MELTDEEIIAFEYDWDNWARPNQKLPPGDWRWTLFTAGRGAGKTRAGTEIVLQEIKAGNVRNVGLVGFTPTDVENVMINGPAGIIARSPPGWTPKYNTVTKILTFPNGTKCYVGSGAVPAKLRGKQFDFVWVDELAFFDYPDETWLQLNLCLRLKGPKGMRARGIITTTPILSDLMQEIHDDPDIEKIQGSTMDNLDNLDPAAVKQMFKMYAGTAMERQELYGELLSENAGALWSHAKIVENRVKEAPEIERIFLGVDPSISSWGTNQTINKKVNRDEVGIVAVGLGVDDNGYVLGDHSGMYPVDKWRDKILDLAAIYPNCEIVAEKNQGGEMIRQMFMDGEKLRGGDNKLTIHTVTARTGKILRAQPISIAYERKRIFHVGTFPILEKQMTTYSGSTKEASPDRLDALVWACTLMLKSMRNYLTEVPRVSMDWKKPFKWTM